MGIPLWTETEEKTSSKKQNAKLIRAINDLSRTIVNDEQCDNNSPVNSRDRLLSLGEFLRETRRRSDLNLIHGNSQRSDDDTFESLLVQIRALGDVHDASLGQSSSEHGEDTNWLRGQDSDWFRERRLRAMRSRIDALGQRLSLVRSARAELRSVEYETMQSLEQMSEARYHENGGL